METIYKNLSAFEQAMRADDDRSWLSSVMDSAGSDGLLRLTLANLDTSSPQERAMLLLSNRVPVRNIRGSS